jgi:hypothetical protein
MPIRDVNDIVVLQTAVIGEANILCTRDEDFYDPVATEFLGKVGITVMDDISLMHRLLSCPIDIASVSCDLPMGRSGWMGFSDHTMN